MIKQTDKDGKVTQFEIETVVLPGPTEEEIAADIQAERNLMFVTMRQARQALLYMGLLDSVEAALTAIIDPTDRSAALIAWEYSQEVQRTFPWVQALLPEMGFTDSQIDDLFTYAATL